ncbi:MAG: nucleotidyltransferase domain-containing protein [Candidatus Hodarchaeota archaeon]
MKELETFLERIRDSDPVLILLFGSLATGKFTQHSDMDVLCVFALEFPSPRERFLQSYRHSDGIVQPKSCSLREFKELVQNGDSFLLRILEEGYILQSAISDSDLQKWISQGKKRLRVALFPPNA